jgi:hypothetical protein
MNPGEDFGDQNDDRERLPRKPAPPSMRGGHGWREENASKKEIEPPFRTNRKWGARPQDDAIGFVFPERRAAAMPYRHSQRGTLIMFLCLVLAGLDAAIAWRTGQWLPVVVLIILVAVAFIFSSLTVEVNGGEFAMAIRSRILDGP